MERMLLEDPGSRVACSSTDGPVVGTAVVGTAVVGTAVVGTAVVGTAVVGPAVGGTAVGVVICATRDPPKTVIEFFESISIPCRTDVELNDTFRPGIW